MAINFPNSPNIGDSHTHNGVTWIWSGTSWDVSIVFQEVNDLTSAVTWANVPDANITQSSVTQHEAALSLLESQITDLQHYSDSALDLHLNVSTASDGQVLSWDSALDDYAWVENPAPTGDSNRVVYDLTDPANSVILDAGDGINPATYYGDVIDSAGNTIVDVSSTSATFTGTLLGSVAGNSTTPDGQYTILDVGTDGTDGILNIANITADGTVNFTGATVTGLNIPSSTVISDFTPSNPSNGDLWWNSEEGSLKIYYTDSDSAQWVDASSSGSGGTGSSGSSVTAQGFRFKTSLTDAGTSQLSDTRGYARELVSPKSGTGKLKFKVYGGDVVVAGESFTIESYVNEDLNTISSSIVIDENNYNSINSMSFEVQELDFICFRVTYTGMNTTKRICGTFEI